MVASSSSSLTRSPPAQPTQSVPKEANISQLHSSLSLRSKRIRTATALSDHDHDHESHKRRKISARQPKPQPLRIPLRGKAAGPQLQAAPAPNPSLTALTAPTTAPAPTPDTDPDTDTPPPTQSSTPTGKPQYDQIRLIEEKARNSIRSAYSSNNSNHSNNNNAAAADDQRKLRKHGSTRLNTELAQYFPNFHDMLSLEPQEPQTLTPKTTLILLDDTPNYAPPVERNDRFGANKPLHNTTIINLPLPPPQPLGPQAHHDPMSDQLYDKIHRKHERHEKQMKNGDRERAQHEKYQLERLLDELRGPDWLRTLGISGITETEKKGYEPKRQLFVREIQAMIDKFKWWKEEEKRRKLERQQELREEAAAAAASSDPAPTTHPEEREREREPDRGQARSQRTASSASSASTQPPNSSEIDALAAQQLLDEAKSANRRKKSVALDNSAAVPMSMPAVLPSPSAPSPIPKSTLSHTPPHAAYKPFTSFFAKRHLRDAAVSGRQRGRTVLAFGHPLPEQLDHEHEFALPDSILTPDAIKSSQRSRRRKRREQ